MPRRHFKWLGLVDRKTGTNVNLWGSAAGGGRRGSPRGRPFAGGGYRTKRVVGPPPRRREGLRGAPSFDAARSHAL
jgi:hypothetical protein